jgi:hypothetical protein
VADTSYSPRLRTALVLCGAGTAGAYQSGVLRGLVEAGVKIDIVAAHGAGSAVALGAAIDGGAAFWGPAGPWLSGRLGRAYRWRLALRIAGVGIIAAALCVLSPLLVLALATGVYGLSLLAGLVSLRGTAAWLIDAYARMLDILFHPPILPTIVPRLTVLALLLVLGVLVVSTWQALRHERSRRRFGGVVWWRLLGAPVDAREPGDTLVSALWRLVHGASQESAPAPEEIGRRYADQLADNFGQPGFREVLLAVHDLDTRRDLVASILTSPWKATFMGRRRTGGPREAEAIEFAGSHRDLLVDWLRGSLKLPVVCAPELMQFPTEGYWRGEAHRVSDRPELPVRLVEELASLGVEQVVLVTPAPAPALLHAMRARPADLRGRMGEWLRSAETAAFEDAAASAGARFSGVFVIRPDHNPIGPFDFTGTYDEASDRTRTLPELLQQGYDDAYRQFIEPVVASGERVEAI